MTGLDLSEQTKVHSESDTPARIETRIHQCLPGPIKNLVFPLQKGKSGFSVPEKAYWDDEEGGVLGLGFASEEETKNSCNEICGPGHVEVISGRRLIEVRVG